MCGLPLLSNMARQAGLSCALFLRRQAAVVFSFGMKDAQSRNASGVQAASASAVVAARAGVPAARAAHKIATGENQRRNETAFIG